MISRIQEIVPRLSLAKRFMLGSLAVLLLAMAGIGAWVSHQIEAQVVHRTAATTALYVDSLIAPSLQNLGAAPSLRPQDAARLDWLMRETPLGRQVAVFQVWDPAGRVVYGTVPTLVGRQFPVTAELSEALKGQVAADIGDIEGEAEVPAGVPRHDLLEIYSPVRSSGTDTVIGAAEFYYGTAELRDEIADAQRRSWFVVGGTTLLIYLLLAAFVQRASNTIVGQQRALAGQVARLTELLHQNEDLHARVRGAAARTTALNERFLRRFSAELHDGPAQEISLALLRLDHVAARCGDDGLGGEEKAAMAHDLDLIQASLSRALQDVRATSSGLLLPQLGALTLAQTVEHVVRGHRRRTGSTPTVHLRNLPDQAPLVAKIALYRILQESLQNASRHAPGADQRVTVEREDGHLRVEVRDTGSGFEVVTIGSSEEHLGLVGMRERVESLGGDFRIESAPGRGTQVVVALPLPPNGENDE